jgi:hypothetical protein
MHDGPVSGVTSLLCVPSFGTLELPRVKGSRNGAALQMRAIVIAGKRLGMTMTLTRTILIVAEHLRLQTSPFPRPPHPSNRSISAYRLEQKLRGLRIKIDPVS